MEQLFCSISKTGNQEYFWEKKYFLNLIAQVEVKH